MYLFALKSTALVSILTLVTMNPAIAQNPFTKPFNINEINASIVMPTASIVGEWKCVVDGRPAQMNWRDEPAAFVGALSIPSFSGQTARLDHLEDTFKPAPSWPPNRPATRITTFRSDNDTASLRWITNDRLTGTMTWQFLGKSYPVSCDRVRVILTQ